MHGCKQEKMSLGVYFATTATDGVLYIDDFCSSASYRKNSSCCAKQNLAKMFSSRRHFAECCIRRHRRINNTGGFEVVGDREE